MKNEKAKNVLIVVLIILVLACVGYIAYPYVVKKDNANLPVTENENGNVNQNIKVKTLEDYVYTKSSKKDGQYNCELPYINLTSEDANTVNKEIETKYSEMTNTGLDTIMNYSAGLNENILSVAIELRNFLPSPVEEYMVYNFDITTGKKVDTDYILNKCNIEKETVYTVLKQKYIEKLDTYNLTGEDDYDSSYSDTLADENYKDISNLFIDSQGKINVVAKIFLPAGDCEEIVVLNTGISTNK